MYPLYNDMCLKYFHNMAEKISQVIQKGNLKRILKFMNRRNLHLTEYQDNKGNNLLHLATLNNNLTLLKSLQEHVIYNKIALQYKANHAEILLNWVNQSNVEGFFPIHYAVYRGFFVRLM